MIVVMKLRGKEYIVTNGSKILVEVNELADTLEVPATTINFDGSMINSIVTLNVVRREKSEKKITFRKARRNAKYRKVGSRQPITMFLVTSIV